MTAVRIPNWTYRREYRAIAGEVEQALLRVLESGRLILGPEVERFEEEFSTYLGGAAVVGVGSGTDAIETALRAVGVRPGDEVATVANTAVPTVAAVRRAGAVPVFIDVSPETCLMDPGALSKRMTPFVRAILPVHLFGQAGHLVELASVADRWGVPLVEDCAQAHGCRHAGRPVGTVGAAGAYSFYPTKPLGAYGDAGAVVSRDSAVASFVRTFRQYGMKQPPVAEREGTNSRLDELQAAVLRVKLRRLPESLEKRRFLAQVYDAELAATRARPVGRNPSSTHSFYLYVIRVPDRDRVLARLSAAGIEARVHYPVPIHLMPAYEPLGYRKGDLPETERACAEVLSLPFFPGMTEAEIVEVVRELRKALV